MEVAIGHCSRCSIASFPTQYPQASAMLCPSKFLVSEVKGSCATMKMDMAGAAPSGFNKRKKKLSVKCEAAAASNQIGVNQMLVYVPPHPLIKHWVSVLRNEFSPPPIFKSAMAELGRLLIYEASRDWLETIGGEVQTPCGVANVEFIDPREPVKVVPILRAGLVLVEHVSSVLPATQTYHLGFVRNEVTLQPTLYLNKLPDRFPDSSLILVADPMLATGGTIVAAIEELTSRGADVKNLRVVAAVAAPPALKILSEKFPGLRVYTGTIDPGLNEKGSLYCPWPRRCWRSQLWYLILD
ncbi:hypothetical protein O6H91_06G004600 [Diphasiastrum complanatum]|uniref:Uncharacterized protein n=1 Tax=Diphasiastrum complanatum TaxID=34168 RepID=A0ACC2DAT5_DIPCM|nr:hypothetical protein O6H91_06G004600 [Diphasiastrum complanatum]